MNNFLVAEFINSIDEIVKQPVHLTQRIKYTCCDVSQKFIVFGASSGGLYVFNRHPCSFEKLIPSTEGSVIYVCISPDEKMFALATSRGTICLVQIDDKNVKDIQIYQEHVGNIVTAMKWNEQSNELYAGDNTGKISALVMTNFITKSMFQTPCATLMQLDSRITQIDVQCHFLLISTLSRCYLCDTDKEQYRQIGQKLRDGEYGACLFGLGSSTSTSVSSKHKQINSFRILSDKESFNTSVGWENIKVFCARPGMRLWEVQIDGKVVRTHQFKQTLTDKPSCIIPIFGEDNRIDLIKRCEINQRNQSFNFKKMYILKKQFIMTFTKDGFYILDPQNAQVIIWTNIYTNISDVKIIDNFIYLWTQDNKIHVLLFSKLETFLIKCLINKKYMLSADLCITFEAQIRKLSLSSNKLQLLNGLSQILLEKNEKELHERVFSIIKDIKKHTDDRQVAQRLNSGIFVIDNTHFIRNTFLDNTDVVNYESKTDKLKPNISAENLIKLEKTNLISNEDNNKRNICRIYEQYELDKAIGNFNPKVVKDILDSCVTYDDIQKVFIDFENYAVNLLLQADKTDIKIWSYKRCLYYIYKKSNEDIDNAIKSKKLGVYLFDAFIALNCSFQNSCDCKFPLPKASQMLPKFCEIGDRILKQKYVNNDVSSYLQICYEVPYMWKFLIELRQNEVFKDLLPLIIQFNCDDIFNLFLNKFTYDSWDDALKLFITLQSGKCLKCEKSFEDNESAVSWTTFGQYMIRSIGAESTVNLLLEYSHEIPLSALNINFYQSSIFSTLVDNFQCNLRSSAVQFVNEISESVCQQHFGKLLEKTLQAPLLNNASFSQSVNSKIEESCSSCQMPLQTPVLLKEKFVFLKCGHFFHAICFKHQDNICNICKPGL